MGLFHNLLDTYSKCEDIVGVVRYDDNGEANEKKTFLPIYHITFKSEFCVLLNEKGELLDITRDKGQTIIIPCTEKSVSRSRNIAAYPLCEKLDYVSGKDQNKYDNYLFTLGNWKELASGASKRKLEAVYDYIKNKTILEDIISRDLLKDSEYKDKSKKIIDFIKIKDIGVRFQVQIPGDMCMSVWEDKDLRQSWIDCYNLHYDKFDSKKSSLKEQVFDYINGNKVYRITANHPKKIISTASNAKLISCNDKSGLTYRGRFKNENEALIIDYEQSQKIHQALIWLINNYGFNIDTQSLIIWAIDANPQPLAIPLYDSMTIYNNLPSQETEVDLIERVETDIYANYSKELKKFLLGYGKVRNIKKQERKICIAILDATTKNTGRLSITFYQELSEGDYLENIVNWHEETSFYLYYQIKNKEDKEKNALQYIGAPSFDDIMLVVYGKPRKDNDKAYKILSKKMRKQLLECMFSNCSLPKYIVDSAARRASQPMSFKNKNNSFNNFEWQQAVNISCALIRKYYNQNNKNQEEYKMELEENRRDRDYLYGRLLAIADKLEQTALYHANKDQRATNAVRLMNAFSLKPYHTWGILYHQLLPYRMQLNGATATFFQQKIDEVMALFKEGDLENNRPLSPLYLLGYSAQMRALTKKQDKEENKNVE